MKCKEQFRLSRNQPSEEGTVSLPKHRVAVSTDSSCTQTDPIQDKGFGVSSYLLQLNGQPMKLLFRFYSSGGKWINTFRTMKDLGKKCQNLAKGWSITKKN